MIERTMRIVRRPKDLARQAAYSVGARRAARRAHVITEQVLASWDQPAFIERFRPYWDPFPTKRPAKFLDLSEYVQVAAVRYTALGLFDDGRPKRILDIGTGCAYFLSVCRTMGHDVLGLDLDDEPLYNEMVDFLDVPRLVHRVTPDDPLPALDGTFDLVSAFCICFNLSPDGSAWTTDQWVRVIDGLLAAVSPDGQLILEFNRDRAGRLYPVDLPARLDARAGRRNRFFGSFLSVQRTAAGPGG